MAMALTYDNTLSRIRISADVPAGLTASVDVERSVNGVTWAAVRGGSDIAAVALDVVSVDDYEFPAGVAVTYRLKRYDAGGAVIGTDPSESITQELAETWIKNPARPFLNRPMIVTGVEPEISRPARSGIFEVPDRRYPVAVTGPRGSRRFAIEVLIESYDDARDFDLILSSGEPVFVHSNCKPLPSMYAVVSDTTQRRQTPVDDERYLFTLPLIEVAAPSATIVGATVNWNNVVNSFAAWSDLISGEATWDTVLERIGDPADIIVE